MKKQIIISTVSLIVIMFIASCSNNSSESKTENVKYQCSMKCEGEKTYDKPGQCPVCNMDLVKVEAHHDHKEHNHSH